MKEGHQNLVEEHKNNNVNLFKKVLITTKRAKSLYSLEESARSALNTNQLFRLSWKITRGR
ncbi:MAG: hypothetical protein Ct9H300mP28_13520 [Pseudomonadota bacterium]|nr:MAG: hypothetical protein Ct9H300mP28_13520 [Pseudomonadota bacterium]